MKKDTGHTKFRRRHFFIKKDLQARFVLGFSLAVFLGFILNLLLVYFLIDRELAGELYKIHIKIRTTSEIAAPILWKLSAIIIPSILVVSAAVGYFLTRRIELPLLTFIEAARKTGKGDFTQNLPKELPTELPEVFNKMGRSLENIFRPIKKSAATVDEKFNTLYRLKAEKASRAELLYALNELAQARKNITNQFSKLKV